ncbi:MAG TPA: DegV family protein [Bacilli bacterium]|nr:DegV family protein [Bacilli bacterium]
MAKIKIVTDTTADLTKELYEKLDCEVLPLHVTINEKTYQDTVEITTPELYQIMDETKQLPKTSAINPDVFLETFKKVKDEGYDGVIVTGIGSNMSSTMQSAKIAADQMEDFPIRLVDSLSLSSGTGLLILNGRQYLEQGHSLDETADYMNSLVPKVRAQFIVESLDIIYRGGRISGAKYLFGKMLKAHPFIQMNEAKLVVADTPKGKIHRALDKQFDVFLADLEDGIDKSKVFITHSVAPDYVDYYLEKLKEYIPSENIIVTEAGAVISSHCGPGTIGILYIKN